MYLLCYTTIHLHIKPRDIYDGYHGYNGYHGYDVEFLQDLTEHHLLLPTAKYIFCTAASVVYYNVLSAVRIHEASEASASKIWKNLNI